MLIKSAFVRGLLSFYYLSNKKERVSIIISLMLIVGSITITIVTPYLFKTLIANANVITVSPYVQNLILVFYIILWCLGKVNLFIREIILTKALEAWKNTLCMNYFKNIFNKFYQDLLKPEVGETMAMIEKIHSEVPHFILTTVLLLIPTMIEICIISIILTIQYGVHLGVISISLFLLILYVNTISSKKLMKYQRSVQKAKRAIYKFANDRLNNIQTIFNYGMQHHEYQLYSHKLKLYTIFEIKNRIYAARSNILQSLIIFVMFTYMTLWSYYRVKEEILTIYDFILINALFISIINPIHSFALVFRNLRRSIEEIKEVWEVQDNPNFYVKDTVYSIEIIEPKKIDLENVSFLYQNNIPVLQNINITFAPNSRTAIVGYSGIGKSTFCNLISYLKPIKGEIKIGDINKDNIPYDILSQYFGIVSQTQGLFMESLLYNITYGCTNYSNKDLEEIIEGLQLSDLISALPHGINSDIAAFGSNLSDGQKQKVLIARVLLKAPKIVILDEATSNMDFRTEAEVYNFLFKRMSSSTIIAVSHRLSSIVKFCDRVVVLSDNKIDAIGSHELLIQTNKIYKSLWQQNGETSEITQ